MTQDSSRDQHLSRMGTSHRSVAERSCTVCSARDSMDSTKRARGRVGRTGAAVALLALMFAVAAYAGGTAGASTPGWAVQSVPSPAASFDTPLSAVSCSSTTACTAVGSYYSRRGHPLTAPLALRWDGRSWALESPVNPRHSLTNNLTGVSCPTTSWCVAVGYYFVKSAGDAIPLAEQWNGKAWTVESVPQLKHTSSFLQGVSCSSTTFCVAVGLYYSTGANAASALIERWDGTRWSIQTTGATDAQLWAVSCPSSTACEAAGYHVSSSGPSVLAERWTGSKWVAQATAAPPGGAQNTYLGGVSCWAPNSCIAAGGTNRSKAVPASVLSERWNGNVWSEVGMPIVALPAVSQLISVSCSSATACSAVGQSSDMNSRGVTLRSAPLVERWNGTRWTIEPSPNPAVGTPSLGVLAGVSCVSSTSCVAVGWFTSWTSPGSDDTV